MPDVEVCPKAGKMFVQKGEKLLIARNLLKLGLVRRLRAPELIWIKGEPLTNGAFGVEKDTQLADGRKILRLIVTLTATNSITRGLEGDIELLPFMGQWKNIALMEGEALLWSWEDLKCCFYIFGLPEAWSKHFVLDWKFTGTELGFPDGEESWLGLGHAHGLPECYGAGAILA